MAYEDDELERMRIRREMRKRQNARKARMARPDGEGEGGTAGEAAASGSSHARSADHGTHRNGHRSGSNGTGSRSGAAGHGARKRNGRKRHKKRRIWLIALEVMLILGLAAGAFAWYLYQRTFGSMQKIEFNEAEVQNLDLTQEQLEEMKGYFNIVCFGVDSRMEGGKQNVGRGTNADVNMIVSANLETGNIRIVSVFRDTYLNISDKNSYNKINAAYAFGGPEQAVKALNKNLGLNVTQYATFNWGAVAQAINILGGVDVDISEPEFSWINAYITETVKETGIGSVHLTHAGHVHLDGIQAVAYARIRYSDTDYARTERQRIIIEKAFQKAKSADWAVLNNILQTITPQLATNVTIADLVPLARRITKFNIEDTMGFPGARGEKDMGKIGDCVIPQTLAYNVRLLHEFLFNETGYEVPSKVQEISNHIASVSGFTSNAKVVGHVAVDEGITADRFHRIMANRRATARQNELEAVTDEEMETKSRAYFETDEDGNRVYYETDEDGNRVYYETDEDGSRAYFETDENGEKIYVPGRRSTAEYPTDEDGNVLYPTDEDGNVVQPTSFRRVTAETDEDGNPVYETDIFGRPIDPEETEDEGFYGPGGPGAQTRATVKPGSLRPGETTGETEDESAVGPGASRTTDSGEARGLMYPGMPPEEDEESGPVRRSTEEDEESGPVRRSTEEDEESGPVSRSAEESGNDGPVARTSGADEGSSASGQVRPDSGTSSNTPADSDSAGPSGTTTAKSSDEGSAPTAAQTTAAPETTAAQTLAVPVSPGSEAGPGGGSSGGDSSDEAAGPGGN